MSIYAPIALCFILYITVFIAMAFSVPEMKLRYLFWASLLGLLSVIPIAFIEYIVLGLPIFTSQTFMSVMITALVFNGLVEETIKMIFLLLIPSKKPNLQTFLAVSILCGLTLGSFESVIYFLRQIQTIGAESSWDAYHLIIIRMATSVVIHALCAGLSGLYLWSFHKRTTHVIPFIYAVLLHGLYNFFAGFSSGYRYFSIAVILLTAEECRIWYKKEKDAKNENVSLDKSSHKH